MLDENAVRLAFELLTGEAAPNPKHVAKLAQSCKNVRQLRTRLMAMPAVQKRIGENGGQGMGVRLLAAPKPEVEVDVPPEQLARLLAHVEGVWRKFGETDAHWSVLTNERYRKDSLEQNKAEFYASGEKNVERFQWAAARCGVDLSRLGSCLELGAGVGRVTMALAKVFPKVHAADISASHLALAAEEAKARGLTNIDFHRVATVAELDALPEVDAFFTVITLQHSPPPVMKLVLEKVLARLRPGGIGHFQLPTMLVGYRFTVEEFFAGVAQKQDMEHHCLPQPVVFDIVERAGCRVLECQHDTLSRLNKVSNTFTVQKRGA
jgi:SAM-dependent methyltransferase